MKIMYTLSRIFVQFPNWKLVSLLYAVYSITATMFVC